MANAGIRVKVLSWGSWGSWGRANPPALVFHSLQTGGKLLSQKRKLSLSGSLIFFPGVLKRQLFCFVLVGNWNIRWHTHPNPHNKIWIGTQRVRVRPPDLAHKNAEYSLKFGFQLNDKSFYRRSASHSIFEKCAKKSYLVVSWNPILLEHPLFYLAILVL